MTSPGSRARGTGKGRADCRLLAAAVVGLAAAVLLPPPAALAAAAPSAEKGDSRTAVKAPAKAPAKAEREATPPGLGGILPGGDGKERRAPGAAGHQIQPGWAGFTDLEAVLDIVIALLLATILSASIAWHPKTRRKASTLEEIDQPKIFIMYAVVGAIIGVIVVYEPLMAAVVFGIGGLLRFRTDVGPAKDTGRVILVTLLGIGCGLKVYPFVVLATAFAWILLWFLESRMTHRLLVKGLDQALLLKAAEAYQEVLRENGLRLLSQKKNYLKGQVAFVFQAPGGLDREQLESLFKDIPPKLQGAVDWESS